MSPNHSAELGAVASGSVDHLTMVAAELSGNIFTGDLLLIRDLQSRNPQTLPPANRSSFAPSVAQDNCIGREPSSSAWASHSPISGGEEAPSDSAEVWVIRDSARAGGR